MDRRSDDRRDNANIDVYMYADGATGRCSWFNDVSVRCRAMTRWNDVTDARAVTTIEADETAASSNFLKKKNRKRKRKGKRAKDKISISALLKGIFGM